jgi:hypothetical protein
MNSISGKTVHFRYVRLRYEKPIHDFEYKGQAYRISFESGEFAPGEGFDIERIGGDPYEYLPGDLLAWLTVYVGEDALEPRQRRDPVHAWTRGLLAFSPDAFNAFLRNAARYPRRSDPQWKRRLFDRALTFYGHATRLGVYSMPISLGLFCLSLECLGNLEFGTRDKYFTFGERRFVPLLRRALVREKRRETTRERTRRFEKFVLEDIELMNKLRNAFYGHSLLHLKKDRGEIALALRRWYLREGFTPAFAKRSFRVARIEHAMTREFWSLYKLALRVSRLFLFIATRAKPVPYASHDFRILGDLKVGSARKRRSATDESNDKDERAGGDAVASAAATVDTVGKVT